VSAEHRKPVVAFVALALTVLGLIGVQRADAQHGQVLAAAVGAEVEVRGQLPAPSDAHPRRVASRVTALGPAFVALDQGTDLADSLLLSRTSVPEGRATERTSPVVRVVPRSPRASGALAQKVSSRLASQRAQGTASGQKATFAGAGVDSGQASSSGGQTPVRTPVSSKASARATQAAAGAATAAKRDATRNRAPRSVRPGRGR